MQLHATEKTTTQLEISKTLPCVQGKADAGHSWLHHLKTQEYDDLSFEERVDVLRTLTHLSASANRCLKMLRYLSMHTASHIVYGKPCNDMPCTWVSCHANELHNHNLIYWADLSCISCFNQQTNQVEWHPDCLTAHGHVSLAHDLLIVCADAWSDFAGLRQCLALATQRQALSLPNNL